MEMEQQTAEEWEQGMELLAEVRRRFPDLTLGESVHIAARLEGCVHAWDAMPGAVASGLRSMLRRPPGGRWGCGLDGPTYRLTNDNKPSTLGKSRE